MTFSHVESPAAPKQEPLGSEARTKEVRSSTIEAALGGASVVLAIIGLVTQSVPLAAIAAICIGIALLANFKTMDEHFKHGLESALKQSGNAHIHEELRVETVGGLIGILFGVLALVGVIPIVLLSANAIVMGFVMLFAGAVSVDIDATGYETASELRKRKTEGLFMMSSSGRIVAAVTSIILGIVALNSLPSSLPFVFAAQLTLGLALLLSGGAIARWTAKAAR